MDDKKYKYTLYNWEDREEVKTREMTKLNAAIKNDWLEDMGLDMAWIPWNETPSEEYWTQYDIEKAGYFGTLRGKPHEFFD